MPGLSGAELARAITTRRPGLPVLLLTGWGSLPGPTAESHVTAVLAKPVTLATLRETIDASVRHPHAGGEAA
jgi:FixJ family two-component response regulator